MSCKASPQQNGLGVTCEQVEKTALPSAKRHETNAAWHDPVLWSRAAQAGHKTVIDRILRKGPDGGARNRPIHRFVGSKCAGNGRYSDRRK